MATAGTQIDVKKALLTMTVHSNTMTWRIFAALKRSAEPYDCFSVDVVQQLVKKSFIETCSKDPLEVCIAPHGMDFENIEALEAQEALNAASI